MANLPLNNNSEMMNFLLRNFQNRLQENPPSSNQSINDFQINTLSERLINKIRTELADIATKEATDALDYTLSDSEFLDGSIDYEVLYNMVNSEDGKKQLENIMAKGGSKEFLAGLMPNEDCQAIFQESSLFKDFKEEDATKYIKNEKIEIESQEFLNSIVGNEEMLGHLSNILSDEEGSVALYKSVENGESLELLGTFMDNPECEVETLRNMVESGENFKSVSNYIDDKLANVQDPKVKEFLRTALLEEPKQVVKSNIADMTTKIEALNAKLTEINEEIKNAEDERFELNPLKYAYAQLKPGQKHPEVISYANTWKEDALKLAETNPYIEKIRDKGTNWTFDKNMCQNDIPYVSKGLNEFLDLIGEKYGKHIWITGTTGSKGPKKYGGKNVNHNLKNLESRESHAYTLNCKIDLAPNNLKDLQAFLIKSGLCSRVAYESDHLDIQVKKEVLFKLLDEKNGDKIAEYDKQIEELNSQKQEFYNQLYETNSLIEEYKNFLML